MRCGDRDFIPPKASCDIAPETKREADLFAFTLFCVFSFILVGLILAGVL